MLAVESQNANGRSDVYIMRPGESDHPVVLQNAWDSSWSPDGARLSAVHYCHPPSCPSWTAIYTASADGTDFRRLSTASDDPDGNSAVWSPDGNWIAYGTKNRIALRSRDDSRLSFPASYGNKQIHDLAWSPDSNRLAFATDDGIYLVGRAGGASRKLGGDQAMDLAWSPDGSALAFTRVLTDRPHARAALIEVRTGKERDLAPSLEESGVPVWSPEGMEIAFLGSRSEDVNPSGRSELWLVKGDGTNLRSLGGGWYVPPYGSVSWLRKPPDIGIRSK
jgi:Tol biopolymer transport system component